jgi:hypothetical protein
LDDLLSGSVFAVGGVDVRSAEVVAVRAAGEWGRAGVAGLLAASRKLAPDWRDLVQRLLTGLREVRRLVSTDETLA